MTNQLRHSARELQPRRPRSNPLKHSDSSSPIRGPSLIAGAALLLLSGLAAVGYVVIVQGLVTPGDPAVTASDIRDSEGVFRLGVAMLYLVIVLDLVVAWALLAVFTPVSRGISRLAAWFRLAYSAVFMVAIGQLAGIPDLLSSAGYSTAFTSEQLQGQALLKVDAFTDIYMAGLILFGGHLILLGYLAYRSGFVPKIIGALLLIAGVGYVLDSFVTVFTIGSPFAISTVTFLGEFLLALWLVIRGRSVSLEPPVMTSADGGHIPVPSSSLQGT
jgi:uncharacterized membrane protein YhdT